MRSWALISLGIQRSLILPEARSHCALKVLDPFLKSPTGIQWGSDWTDVKWFHLFAAVKILLLQKQQLHFIFQTADMKETSDPGQIREIYSIQNTADKSLYSNSIPACTDEFLMSKHVYVCRERPAQPAGGADEPTIRSHAASGERAGPGQTVCWDPSFYTQLWWTKGEGNDFYSNYSPHSLTFTALQNQYIFIEQPKNKLPLLSLCRWQTQPFRMTSATTGGP